MKKRTLIAILLALLPFVGITLADTLKAPPALEDEPVSEQQYLKHLYDNIHKLPVISTSPDGVRRGDLGELIVRSQTEPYALWVNRDGATDWSLIGDGTGAGGGTCPEGASGEVQTTDGTNCIGDEGFTFSTSTNLVNINEATDGNSILLRLDNDQANSAGSTNETSQLRFGFGTDTDVARITVGKVGDFSTSGLSDAFMTFNVDSDGTSTEIMRLKGGDTTSILGVLIGATSGISNASLYIEPFGNTINDYGLAIRDNTGTYDMLFTRGDAVITMGDVDYSSAVTISMFGGGAANLFISGSTNDVPANITLQDTQTNAHVINLVNPSAGIYSGSTYLSFDGPNLTDLTVENPFILFDSVTSGASSQSLTLGSGATIGSERYIQFIAPKIDGIAGGGTETISTGVTVYIDNAPFGSNITISDPYAFMVESGDSALGSHIISIGQLPTVSSCGASASVVGTDIAGKVTVGTTALQATCTLTFFTPFDNAPSCFANDETNILLVRSVSTTTTVVFDVATSFTNDTISYVCLGRD